MKGMVNMPNNTTVVSESQLTTEHTNKLLSESRITPALAAAEGCKLQSVSMSEATRLLGMPVHSGGYVIPYPGMDGVFTVRLDVSEPQRDGRDAKYLWPRGAETHLFIPRSVRDSVSDTIYDRGRKKGPMRVHSGLAYNRAHRGLELG